MVKRLLTVAVLLAAALFIPASPASADTAAQIGARCGTGWTFVTATDIPEGNGRIVMTLYYKVIGGVALNCGILDVEDPYEGQAREMTLTACTQPGPALDGDGWDPNEVPACSEVDADGGIFSQYAGPVIVVGTHYCLRLQGLRYRNAGSTIGQTPDYITLGPGFCD